MNKNIPKTELLFKKSKPIDMLNVSDGISLMTKEQKDASVEINKASKSIELSINKIYKHLTKNPNSRLIYVGAGTSVELVYKMVLSFYQHLIGQRIG